MQKVGAKFCKKNLQLLYKILVRVASGLYCSQIARQLKLKHQLVSYYLKKLEKCGFIALEVRTNYKGYKLTEKGKQFLQDLKVTLKEGLQKGLAKSSSLSMSKTTINRNVRLHNLAIKFKILRDNPNAKFDKKVQINNWLKQYDIITFPIGITIEKTSKHIIVYLHQFQTNKKTFLNDFYQNCLKAVYYVYHYLARQKGIVIDILSGEIVREHIANEAPELNEATNKSRTVEIRLGRKAKAIYPSKIAAKAWIDRSLGNVDIETNDMLYEEKLLMMPEILYDLNQRWGHLEGLMERQIYVMSEFSEQIKLHLNVLQKMSDALDKINEKLDQL